MRQIGQRELLKSVLNTIGRAPNLIECILRLDSKSRETGGAICDVTFGCGGWMDGRMDDKELMSE